VLVLGPASSLESLSQIPVIPVSTQERGLPWEVVLDETDGLPRRCVLKPEWIKSVDRTAIGPWIALLPEHRWPTVRTGVLRALGFED
jgi:mRNA-degrading endonuclease toxin of MazEF toxin-antitoxin module